MPEDSTNNVSIQPQPVTEQKPPATPYARPESLKPTKTNYAAAVFFTLLIVGYTFHLPSVLYIPLAFFCIAAGIYFLKDVLASNRAPMPVWQPVGQVAVYPEQKKKMNPYFRVFLIIIGTIGFCIMAYASFIIIALIVLGSSGI